MASRKGYLPIGESVVSWRDVTYIKIRNLGSGGSSTVSLTIATSGPNKALSDVFQLGLVTAELFTGKNPLVPDSPGKSIQLSVIDEVPGTFGAQIKSTIEAMLVVETSKRESASRLLDRWKELYLAISKRENDERRIASLQDSPKS